MEKLLHERLRECRNWHELDKELGLDDNTVLYDTISAIADEIERTYVALPRDDKGVPVRGGDAFTDGVCEFNANYLVVDLNDQRRYWLFDDYGDDLTTEPFKRPTPKVYDADGVPYRQGETIYGIETGDAFEVLNPNLREGYMEVRELQGKREICEIKPKFYTHERPVFDTEGVRICKGDTVWTLHTGNNFTVDGFTDDGAVIVRFGGDSDDLTTYAPHGLIHHEPDSLEKLYADMLENYNNGRGDYPNKCFGFCAHGDHLERFRALIERGA